MATSEAEPVVNILTRLGRFETVNLYLVEGEATAAPRGEEKTEAEGIGQFIVGNGVQVVARTEPALRVCPSRAVLRAVCLSSQSKKQFRGAFPAKGALKP
jgi:hypothetical protein